MIKLKIWILVILSVAVVGIANATYISNAYMSVPLLLTNLSFDYLTNAPVDCSGVMFVYGFDDINHLWKCAIPAGVSFAHLHSWANITDAPDIDSINQSKLNITDQRYNETALINASIQAVPYQIYREYDHHYYSRDTGFESATAAYTAPWVPTAIGGGTASVGVGTINHPGISYISTHATTLNSGFAYQISGTSTYLLGPNYTTQLSFKPIGKTYNKTEIRFGFMDAFTTAYPTDGVFFNITQTDFNATNFTAYGVARNNSVTNRTTTNFTMFNNTWYSLEIYIYSETNATFRIRNETTDVLLWEDTATSRIPQTTGRETSHAFVAYSMGNATTARILTYLDFMSIGINQTLAR